VAFDLELVLAFKVAATLIGHFVWVIANPRQRISRAARILVVTNFLVWLSFLAFGLPVDNAMFHRAEMERIERDANTGETTLIEDQPIVVGARLHGTFGATNFADWLLTLFAAPAIAFGERLIVPSRYYGIDATKRESFAIAGIGFVLSTCFWAAVGNIVSAWRNDRRRPKGRHYECLRAG